MILKKNILLLGTIVLFLVLAACGTNNGNTGEDPITDPNENTGDAPITDPNDNSAPEDNGNNDGQIENDGNESNNDSNTNEDPTNSDGELITETGIYNGQADPHTIEIETDEGPLAFQLTMDARDDIDALTEGGEVTYKYTEDGDNRTIESIQMNE